MSIIVREQCLCDRTYRSYNANAVSAYLAAFRIIKL